MTEVFPDYYPGFRCIADRCRHTCCAGWEIDIDDSSLNRYRRMTGAMGQKLRRSIALDEYPHFILDETERCPFLNSENLCELILNCGEDALCDICTDHPRFRNFFQNRTETGLGLCCEAAAELVLGKKDKTFLMTAGGELPETSPDPFEAFLLSVREQAFGTAQDRSIPFLQRLEFLKEDFGIRIPEKSASEWADFFLSLERMDESWTQQLLVLRGAASGRLSLPASLEIPFEQLLVYFIYRHLAQAQSVAEIRVLMGFCVLSCLTVLQLCLTGADSSGCSPEALAEYVRLYSSEIEYSEENTAALCKLIFTENQSGFC